MEQTSDALITPGFAPAPFDGLPDELVIEIAHHAHANAQGEPPQARFRAWVQLLHVCTRWRAIIISLSNLWRALTITPKTKRRQLEYCLTLSRDQPLRVYFYNIKPKSMPGFIEQLSGRIPKIQSLSLITSRLDSAGGIFSYDIPALEDLRISAADFTKSRNTILSLSDYPLLRSLKLVSINCPIGISDLRVLHMDMCTWPNSAALANTLLRCPLLEELRVVSSLGEVTQWRAYVPRARLERLRTLIIHDTNPVYIADVLAHVDTPSLESLQVFCPKSHGAGSEHIFQPLLPARQSGVVPTFSGGPAQARLNFTDSAVECIVETPESAQDEQPHPVAVSLSTMVDHEWTQAFSVAVQDFLLLFANARITSLVVNAGAASVPAAVWEQLFSRLPLLETLEVTGSATWTPMWAGLLHASGESICCPSLTTMRVWHTSQSADECAALVDERALSATRAALSMRAQVGAKLQLLQWEVYESWDPRDPHADARGAFLAQLSPYVERVMYEELGYADRVQPTFWVTQ